jgi:hypothetical protein
MVRLLTAWWSRLRPAVGHPTGPAPVEASPAYDIETLRLIHQEIKERSGRLDANSARLDTKATSLLGFVSAISLFLAAQKADGWSKLIAFAALGAAGWLGFQAMRVRTFADAPEPRALKTHVQARSEAAALALLTEAQIRVYETNRVIHERKAAHWRWSLGLLALAVGLTIIALVFGGNNARGGQPTPGPSATATTAADPVR